MTVNFKMPTLEVVSTSPDFSECTVKLLGIQKSMGETIKNSIIRTLLSSIPGIAPMAYTIMGASEEFTVIKGLVNTTTEISLALKNVKVATSLEGFDQDTIPTHFILEISKTYENEYIKFGDFQPTDPNLSVTILNPDEVVSYVSGTRAVNIRLLFWSGIGYATYDEVGSQYKEDIKKMLGEEFIALDSIFSPVTRAIASVVEDSPSKGVEELTITATTDGSIPALTAISQAFGIISATAFVLQQATNIIAKPYKLSVNAARCSINHGRPKDFNENTAIEVFGLSEPLQNKLKHNDINVIGDFDTKDPDGTLRAETNREILKISADVLLPEHEDKLYAAKIKSVEDLIHSKITPQERKDAIKRLESLGFKIEDMQKEE